ncbi:hypothetical protein EAF04_005867 [Stromatinia cepivora]|nr:hypothetical protein EAF04_005867 [Stromatinia cepivora]
MTCIQNLDDAKLQCLKAADVSNDCQLGISKSKLGALTDKGTGTISPASVVYLSFSFRQVGDCKLSKATVTITLAESGPNDKKDKPEIHSRDLFVTDYFGPKQLISEMKIVTITKEIWLDSHLEVQGIGGGVGGLRRTKKSYRTSNWLFEGSRRSPAKYHGVYRTLLWNLTENRLERRAEHSNDFHTAFVLQHECIPFYIEVETEGKLERKRDRLKQAVSFFKFSPKSPGVALFGLGSEDQDYFERNNDQEDFKLDKLANSLEEEMYRENMGFSRRIPDVIPPKKSTLPSNILDASTPSKRTLPPIIPLNSLPASPPRCQALRP